MAVEHVGLDSRECPEAQARGRSEGAGGVPPTQVVPPPPSLSCARCTILDETRVEIGDHVLMGPNVKASGAGMGLASAGLNRCIPAAWHMQGWCGRPLAAALLRRLTHC